MAVCLAAVAAVAVFAGQAWGAQFKRGDVFVSDPSGIQEYSPSGQLQQTVGSTAGGFCFDPSGRHLIEPGVALFDSSGNQLPSHWAAVSSGTCVADASGHVFAATGAVSTVARYDIEGNLQRTFGVAGAIDLAPDDCTIYYGKFDSVSPIGRFNVCTNSQQPPFNGFSFVDDLRVLPDRSVLAADDPSVLLFDPSGQFVRNYVPAPFDTGSQSVTNLALDPDGTSFWTCCDLSSLNNGTVDVFRFEIASGAVLTKWPVAGRTTDFGSPIDVYAPPLVGCADLARATDSNAAGTAEAFAARAGYSGQLSGLHLFVDPASAATRAIVGIYADHNGHPGTLLKQATIANPIEGSWNYIHVGGVSISAGQRYWIAVLGPAGTGAIRFRDAPNGAGSETSAQHGLTALPAKWQTSTRYSDGHLSAFAS